MLWANLFMKVVLEVGYASADINIGVLYEN